jgi:predicted secreted Zn-dependent protease
MIIWSAASGAQAQVNRCTDAHGRVSYADGPCEGPGSRRDGTASRRLSGIVVEHYDVRGADGNALLADLARRGPKGFHGMTNWRYDYRYRYEPAPRGGCRVSSVSTSVSGRILMPRWVDEAKAAAPLRETWQRYVAALMRHEEGHMANGQALSRALQSDLGALTAPTCEQLESRVDRTAQALIDDHRARDHRYDIETRHGTTQGAFLSFPETDPRP